MFYVAHLSLFLSGTVLKRVASRAGRFMFHCLPSTSMPLASIVCAAYEPVILCVRGTFWQCSMRPTDTSVACRGCRPTKRCLSIVSIIATSMTAVKSFGSTSRRCNW
eukprot:297751-Pleurochrysis_carterae.AAC.2